MQSETIDLQLYGGQDPRLKPIYTLAQAAHLAGVSASTLRSWVAGRPYFTQSGERFFPPVITRPEDRLGRVSFVNVIEAHVLSALRRDHQMRLDKIRTAILFVQRHLQTPHPLAARIFQTNGIDLFVEHLGEVVNASQDGQIAMRAIIEAHLSRVEYDGAGQALKLFPFRPTRSSETSPEAMRAAPRVVMVNPFVAFGKPVLAGKGVPLSIVIDRFEAGETPEALAEDYECDTALILDALRYHRLAA